MDNNGGEGTILKYDQKRILILIMNVSFIYFKCQKNVLWVGDGTIGCGSKVLWSMMWSPLERAENFLAKKIIVFKLFLVCI